MRAFANKKNIPNRRIPIVWNDGISAVVDDFSQKNTNLLSNLSA